MTKNDDKARPTPIYCLDLDDRYCQIKLDAGCILFLCFVPCYQRRNHLAVNVREKTQFNSVNLGGGWLSIFYYVCAKLMQAVVWNFILLSKLYLKHWSSR